MLQEKKLRVQEEQNLTSALISEGRGLLDAAAAPANASGEALAVKSQLSTAQGFQGSLPGPRQAVTQMGTWSQC